MLWGYREDGKDLVQVFPKGKAGRRLLTFSSRRRSLVRQPAPVSCGFTGACRHTERIGRGRLSAESLGTMPKYLLKPEVLGLLESESHPMHQRFSSRPVYRLRYSTTR